MWSEAIAHLPNLALKPDVVAGDGHALGDCVIETELGSVDLGVRAQLGEIERGFFDRSTFETRRRFTATANCKAREAGCDDGAVRAAISRDCVAGSPGAGAARFSSLSGRPSSPSGRWPPWASAARSSTSRAARTWPR